MPIRAHCGNILGRFRDDIRNFESITWFHVEMNSYNAVFHKRTNKKSEVGIFFFILCSRLWILNYAPSLICLHLKEENRQSIPKGKCLKMPILFFLFLYFFNCVSLVAPCASLFSVLGQQHCMCLSLQCPSCSTAIGSSSWV